jgi:hypothetical protein
MSKKMNNDEKPKEIRSMETSFDYWQHTAAYALRQYKMALQWATKESNQEWVQKYNQMWSKIYKIYGEELMTQYIKSWQNIWEGFSIESFNVSNEYWKKMLIESSEGTSNVHYETKEKLSEDWIKTWLKS